MALQIVYDTEYGINLLTAYAKVSTYRGDKATLNFEVLIWADLAARDGGKERMAQRMYSIPYNQQVIADLYIYLKTLPEFTGAVDV